MTTVESGMKSNIMLQFIVKVNKMLVWEHIFNKMLGRDFSAGNSRAIWQNVGFRADIRQNVLC